MKKIIVFICVIGLVCGISFGVYTLMNNKEDFKALENSIASSMKLIENSNKKYIEKVTAEDDEWKVILETMQIEENETWDALLEEEAVGNNEEIANAIKEMYIVGVGDSVFLSAIDELKKEFPNSVLDGKVSRSLTLGLPILKQLKSEGKLGDHIILGLATNGDFREDKCRELMSIVGDRTVYWVNAVGADDPNFNRKFAEFASKYPNIKIVRWDRASSNHPEYFYKDGIHIRDAGIDAYAKVVYDTIYKDNIKLNANSKNEMLESHIEETNKRTSFYGNDLLINSFDLISKEFDNSIFNVKRDYTFDELYNDLKEKVDNGTLEYKLVFVFDSSFKITREEYEKIIALCSGHEIYVVNVSIDNLVLSETATVIDLYSKLEKRKDYIMSDNIHLTNNGNKYLVKSLEDIVK